MKDQVDGAAATTSAETTNAGLPNGRALGGGAGAAGAGSGGSAEPLRSNKGKSSSSTKSASKSSYKNRGLGAVGAGLPYGMGVPARRLSRDAGDKFLPARPSSGTALLENHVGHGVPSSGGGEARQSTSRRGHGVQETTGPASPRCPPRARNNPPPVETAEAASRPASRGRGSRRESPRPASPPVVCHNKIFPQHARGTSPAREGQGQAASWGHNPHPSFLPLPREVPGRAPQEAAAALECQVHPLLQDPPPSPTESTML